VHDDAHRHGVLASVRPTHPAAWLRPHPPIRIPCEHAPDRSGGPCANRARHLFTAGSGARGDRLDNHEDRDACDVDVSAMWRRDDRGSDSYGVPARGLGTPRLVMTARSPSRSESDQMCQTHVRISVYFCASSRPRPADARAHSRQVELIPPSTVRRPRVAYRSCGHHSSCL
jgi:hypothetical protein